MDLMQHLLKPALLGIDVRVVNGLKLKDAKSRVTTVFRSPPYQILGSSRTHDLACYWIT